MVKRHLFADVDVTKGKRMAIQRQAKAHRDVSKNLRRTYVYGYFGLYNRHTARNTRPRNT
jgi:hypothetical protein